MPVKTITISIFLLHLYYNDVLLFSQSLQKSKELLRRVDIQGLDEANARECELLEERWVSDECMKAILEFMQRKKWDYMTVDLV